MMRLRRLPIIGSSACAVLALIAGCTVNHHTPARAITTQPATRPVISAKPMIDFSKGAAGFPIEGHLPLDSKANFVAELMAGYDARVQMPTTRPTVVAVGQFPHLDSLNIDLSDGMIRSSYRPTSMKSVRKMVPIATVKSLTYTASPLHYDDASQSLKMTASNAKLELIRGKGDKEVLIMTDATQGEAKFYVSLADLSTIVRDVADDNAERAIFFVRETKLTMSSDNPRSLESTVEVRGFWLLIPTDIKLTGRIDVDRDFNAKLSHLSCTGSEAGGPVLAGFIDSALKKYEGKVMPLAAFPGDKLKMHDLHISVDDALHVDAVFGD